MSVLVIPGPHAFCAIAYAEGDPLAPGCSTATSQMSGDDALPFAIADAINRSGYPRTLVALARAVELTSEWGDGRTWRQQFPTQADRFVEAAHDLVAAWELHDADRKARRKEGAGGA